MADALAASRVVISDGGADPESRAVHAASPLLIGFIAAIFGMAFMAPGVMRNWTFIAGALLMPAFFVAAAIYAWSVINPGDIVGLVVDRASRTIEVVQSNAFAARRTSFAFHDIARIALEQSYDRDGYGIQVAVMTLESGDRLPLAIGLDAHRLAGLRQMLGLADPA
ncbi:MAG: hypothetical protein R3D44_10035 [Hyphomicrobiaceae bacterium]